MSVVTFQSEHEVNGSIAREIDFARFDCFAGTAHDMILLCGGNSIGMRADVVEIIAGNELTLQLFATISQTSVLIAHLTDVKIGLATNPSECGTKGDAGVFVEVKTLFELIVTNSWRR